MRKSGRRGTNVPRQRRGTMMERRTIENLVDMLATSQREVAEMRKNEKEHVQAIFDLERERIEMKRELAELRDRIASLERVADERMEAMQRLEGELEEVEARVQGLQEQVQHKQNHIDGLKHDVEGFHEQVARITKDRNDWRIRAQVAIGETAERKNRIDELEAQLRAGHPDYAESEAQRMAKGVLIASVENALDDAGVGQAKLIDRIDKLVCERDALKGKAELRHERVEAYAGDGEAADLRRGMGFVDAGGPDRDPNHVDAGGES